MDDSLVSTVKRYEVAVAALKQSGRRISAEEILEVLTARAQVQKILSQKTVKRWFAYANHDKHRLWKKRVKELDGELAGKVEDISQAVKLEDWNILLPPSEREWLRLFATPPRWTEQYDWLWQALTLIFLTISLSLLTPLISRFFDGGPDQGVWTVVVPTVIGLLTGGALTRPGRRAIEYALASFNLSKEWWDEVICAVSCLLMLVLFLFWASLPTISNTYEWFGDNKRKCEIQQPFAAREVSQPGTMRSPITDCKRELSSAVKDYTRATKLDPDNANAYFKLGTAYQNLGRSQVGNRQYEIAVSYSTLQDDFALEAFNSLILESTKNRNPGQARTWFEQCEERFKDKPEWQRLCHLDDVASAYLQQKKYDDVSALLFNRFTTDQFPRATNGEDSKKRRYRLLIYLAWALLEQQNSTFAKTVLDESFEIDKLLPQEQQSPVPRCLYARYVEEEQAANPNLLNTESNLSSVRSAWEQCRRNNLLKTEDEVYWYNISTKRLSAMGEHE